MEGIEDKLGAILNDPKMMQQIMSMAKALGSSTQDTKTDQEKPENTPVLDPGILQKLSSISGPGGIDPEQKTLLQALRPYITGERIQKLEKAMRAAKMARFASVFLNSGGLQLLSGR